MMRRRSSSASTDDPPPSKRQAQAPVPVPLPSRRSPRLALADITALVVNQTPPLPSPTTTNPTTSIVPQSRKTTAAMRQRRDRRVIVTSFTPPSSHTDSDSNFEIDRMPPAWLLLDDDTRARLIQWGAHLSRSQSLPLPAPVPAPAPVIRRALSVITNIRQAVASELRGEARKSAYYYFVRAQLAHPYNNTKCAYCGERDVHSLHHELEFDRSGTGVPVPRYMSSTALAREVERCTRADGSIGLVALCKTCHADADKQVRQAKRMQSNTEGPTLTRKQRCRAADNQAKLQRGHCECEAGCGRVVTVNNLREFEWDHLTQRAEDPDYRVVSDLVSGGYPLERCEQERQKCKLLFHSCHHQRTVAQMRQFWSGQRPRTKRQRR